MKHNNLFFEKAREKGLEFHSIVIYQNGKEAARMEAAPYDAETPHMLFSLSKTFCSAAAGFAVQEGLLQYETCVKDVLPECMPRDASEWHNRITLEHLLCMASGLDEESGRLDRRGTDWAVQVLSYPVRHEPGTYFHYNSLGTYLVSCMVQKVTGQTVRDYLMPRLFTPLGIEKPFWDTSPENINCGGWGLYLSTEDIAKFGACVLADGKWEGKQVLPPEWLERAPKKHVENAHATPDKEGDWAQGYGYQIWRCVGTAFRGDGMWGQLCVMDPVTKTVFAATAGIQDIQAEMDLVHEYVLNSFDPANFEPQKVSYPMPENKAAHAPLCGTLTAGEGEQTIECCFTQKAGEALLHGTFQKGDQKLSFSFLPEIYSYSTNAISYPATSNELKALGTYGWERENTLHLIVRIQNAPMTMNVLLHFDGNKVSVEGKSVGMPFENCKTEGIWVQKEAGKA